MKKSSRPKQVEAFLLPAKSIRILLLLSTTLLVVGLSTKPMAQTVDSTSIQDFDISLQSREQLDIRLEESRQAVVRLPEDSLATEQEKQLKASLQRHIALLQEYLDQTDTLLQLQQRDADNTESIKKAKEMIATLSSLAPVPPVTNPLKIDHLTLESNLNKARSQKSNLLNHQVQQQQLEEELSSYLELTNLRYQEADQRESMLFKSKSQDQTQSTLLLVKKQIENSQLEKIIARQSEKLFDERRKWYRNKEPLIRLELEAAELNIVRLEQQLSAYHEALRQQLEKQTKQAEEALMEKEESVQKAAAPDERFIASWEASIARSKRDISESQALVVSLAAEVTEQEKQSILENDEFQAIKHLMSSQDNYNSSERIKLALVQIQQRSALLTQSLSSENLTALNMHRERSYKISDILFGLTDEFKNKRDDVLGNLSEDEKQEFKVTTNKLLAEYRSVLKDEKSALTEVVSQSQKLQLSIEQRLTKLNEFELFIRNTSFWIRDIKPLGWKTFLSVPVELIENVITIQELSLIEISTQLSEMIQTPKTTVYALTLFLILPVGLYRLRLYLREAYHNINDQVQAQGKLSQMAALVVTACLLSAALLPAYFFIIARLAESSQLPANLNNIMSQIFDHLALFFFFWFLSRSFFARRSISEVQFGLPRVAANSLFSALRWFLIGYILMLPWSVLSQAPFDNVAIPRLSYVFFLLVLTIGVYRITRPKSAYVQHQLEALNNDVILKNWKVLAKALVTIAVVSLSLEVTGYQYAARTIAFNLGGTLAILVVLPPLYRLLKWRMLRFVNRRLSSTAETDDKMPTRSDLKINSLRIFKLLSVLVSIVLVLRIWGIDEQALQTLDDIQLYTVQISGADPEFVTLGSLLRCLLFIFITYSVIRGLPSLLNITIFPNWSADVGVKYAVQTISKYITFLIGFFFVIAELHLDLAQLGWLMAAIGVGLGFGLQEIVSNFVSGLILLAERPVKPGDIVTIGNLTGTVSRINIRATTIVNFDRQEVMVPNRNLITTEVINWTRSDTVNRVVIPIGVAYGSDVDFVSSLLLSIAKGQREVLTEPEPTVIFMLHGESSLDLELRVFVSSPDNIMPIRDKLNREISKAFARENIEIPFPQRDLHIKSGNLFAQD
ncbi:mechanosensitive ion channel domain-containing protein [Vibrio sp. HN007]|uniref:mechanosensitive ion channel domain-containing protein n=1 Tax=Vibrio iocasae TaxID=3098914 RepID=UPI0035D49A69